MQTPNDKSPAELRQELLELLTRKGLPQTLAAFKGAVNNRSEAFRQAIELEVQYNELQREFLAGQISKEDENVESNRLTARFIDLIGRLETEPGLLSAQLPAAKRRRLHWGLLASLVAVPLLVGIWLLWPDAEQPQSMVGRVLYSIPPQMQVGRQTRCIVRISTESVSETQLGEGIADTISKKVESIRIGDIMTVDLEDEDEAFRVVRKSTKEQPIEENDITQWLFDVTPLKEGKHELTLKISVRIWIDEKTDVYKDVLTFEREIDIFSEPVSLDTTYVEKYLRIAAADEPPFLDIEEPMPVLPVDVEPETEPSENDTKGRAESEEVEDKKPPPPSHPVRINLCKDSFALIPFLSAFAAQVEEKKILYGTEPLSDCSGIFLRLCLALQEECPNALFPGQDQVRDARTIAKWYYDHENFQLVPDATELKRKIRPGMVLFYGQGGHSYQEVTIENLTRPDGIDHVGVVVAVEKDSEGNVTNYTLFHGRSTGKPAGRTTHHGLRPSRRDLPPYGNGDQQLVATAFLLTIPKDF